MAPRAAYYLTTPIYYVNDSPHIGHAYTSLACDVLARFMRLDGRDVMFLTGTDEHGQKVQKSAIAAGMEPQDFVDQVSERFRALGDVMGYSNDDFIRTTEDRHTRSCQELWRRIEANGHIYLDKYAGWYSVRDEAFCAESEVTDGPDGSKVTVADGSPVEWVEEPSYFFRLSAWQERLLEFYEKNPQAVAPESRRNEVISFVSGGLNDLSVSRASLKWGIPVPGDPDHTMYVWLDALTNYISAAGFPDTECDLYRTYWPCDLHMVGKDILRFHAVYWPAFLMAAGVEPPTRVFAHGWWTNEGEKMSKSLGNVIDPHQIVARYGLDAVRYFLLRALPFGSDGDFSHRAIVGRMNDDLANDYGNLAQRVLTMVNRNCGAQVPEPGAFTPADDALLGAAEGAGGDGAGRSRRAVVSPGADPHLGGRGPGQPLRRRAGSLGAAQGGPAAHGDGALCGDRNAAPSGGAHPALHAGRQRADARSAGRGGRRAQPRCAGPRRAPRAGHAAAQAGADFSAIRGG